MAKTHLAEEGVLGVCYAERYRRGSVRYRGAASAGRGLRASAEGSRWGSAPVRRASRRAASETLRFDGARRRSCSGTPVDARRFSRRRCACLLVAVLLVAGLCLSGPFGKRVSGSSGGESTPVSQWREGEVPLLLQTDPAWAEAPYAGSTVAESGCGPTCLTMAYVCLTGSKDYDPASMCALSEREGYVDSGMTSWGLMNEGVRLLGLTSRELSADASVVKEALSAGSLVIASMAPGDFTTTGHFIVLTGVDDAGRFMIRDPNSAERSAKAWDAQRVLSQCRNLWAISR